MNLRLHHHVVFCIVSQQRRAWVSRISRLSLFAVPTSITMRSVRTDVNITVLVNLDVQVHIGIRFPTSQHRGARDGSGGCTYEVNVVAIKLCR